MSDPELPTSETAKREEEILAFWRENKTFERSLEKDAPKGEFVFYDGPPFATGLPHHGSLLSSIIKDVIPRYKTMQGYRVRRRWGWDTHGLPIENLVEKELGIKTKKEIEEIGVAKFNESARSMVLKYVADWKVYIERIGRWVDYDNSYKTMDNSYIESVWWGLKQLWDKELLYEGRKVLMYCTHCETPLAKAEIAADNTYKDITEEAVTVKFKVKNPSAHGLPENTYLLAWTTTPWTLPGNVALAVGGEIPYSVIKKDDVSIVVAKERQGDVLGGMVVIDKEITGAQLVGLEYEPLFDVPAMQNEKSHRVYAAEFVTTGDGTGIVHTAVMYGEDDYVLGQKEGLPMVQMLTANGSYTETMPESLRGKFIKAAEKDIKKDLDARGLLFEKKNNTHSYPHCWRCGTPLIYNAVASWFINIQKVKAQMLAENQKVNWVPGHLKDGRFGKIVEGAPDWTISRNRFWASPLPIWKSAAGKVMVIGSVEEIRTRAKKSGNTYLVMRHGEADSNVSGFIDGNPDSKNNLTAQGEADVRAAAATLAGKGVHKIYVSPFLRTKETARIVSEVLGLPASAVIVDERLREINPGVFDGRPVHEFQSFFSSYAERFVKAPEKGTTYNDMRMQLGAFMQERELEDTGACILLITHESPAFILSMIARGETPEEGGKRSEIARENLKNAEVRELSFATLPWNAHFELDLHRPYTDSIVLLDDEGTEYMRIPEVVDCWVESGSMPFAEYHYPFENKEVFESRAPGDFIAEYIAQTRTWFYYMHAMGVTLFDRLAFRNVVSTGTILASDGEKISKSKRNYTDPLALINTYGSDAVRLYLMASPVMQAEDLRFRDEDVRDAHNRVIGILWNTFKFFDLYQKDYDGKTEAHKSEHVLDHWILARLDQLIGDMTSAMEAYDTPLAARAFRAFVDEYSTWYVRRSRERVKSEWHDKQYALATQRTVLLTLARLIAPIMPFIAESVWRGIDGGGSVHLQPWPEAAQKGILANMFGRSAEDILNEMTAVRAIVSAALEARDRAGIKVRQPLQKLSIGKGEHEIGRELLEVIREEVNVKGVEIDAALEAGSVRLDTELTPELKEEGFVRDLVRAVQGARKEAGLKLEDTAKITIHATKDAEELIAKHTKEVEDLTRTTLAFDAADGTRQKVGDYELVLTLHA